MALRKKSIFLYGFEITSLNSSIDFKTAAVGPEYQATLRLGFYSLSGLLVEIKRSLSEADALNDFTASADRTFNSGLENRVTLGSPTAGVNFSLLFGTGLRVASSLAPTIGFIAVDRTGAASYQGTISSGTALAPEYVGYSYLGPDMMRNVFGALNISAGGIKEAIVWNVQKFFQMEFKYEPEAKVMTEWRDFMTWAIQQKPIEFTPDISFPAAIFDCTLESTDTNGKGLGYKMTEMLPDFPFNYRTGNMKFRVTELT